VLHARVPERGAPGLGEAVRVTIDPDAVLVYGPDPGGGGESGDQAD
jgi:hypothetical protein